MKIKWLEETTGQEGSGRPLRLALTQLHTYTHKTYSKINKKNLESQKITKDKILLSSQNLATA